MVRRNRSKRRLDIGAVPFFPRRQLQARAERVQIFIGGESRLQRRDLERVFEFAFKGVYTVPGYLKPEPHVIDGSFELGETLITPLPVPHGDSIVNGYLFSRGGEKLVAYMSDCSSVPGAVVDLISGVKVLIIDALRDKPHPTHLSVEQALEVAARVRPDATYFTHIAHELPQAAESRLPAGAHIAYDGLKLAFQ